MGFNTWLFQSVLKPITDQLQDLIKKVEDLDTTISIESSAINRKLDEASNLVFTEAYHDLVGQRVILHKLTFTGQITSITKGTLQSIAQTVELDEHFGAIRRNYFLLKDEAGKTEIITDGPRIAIYEQD